jgi:hypothetical protein
MARRPKRPSQAAMEAACKAFNTSHPIGSKIWVAPGSREGRYVEVEVREPGAQVMSGHTVVVYVTGGHGCIALSHVCILPAPARLR